MVNVKDWQPPPFVPTYESLLARVRELEAEVEAGRKLWKFVLETDEPWGEYQQEFVDMGLLKAVSIAPDAPEDDRCANCEGDCDVCYRPTGLLIDAALAAGKGEGEKF